MSLKYLLTGIVNLLMAIVGILLGLRIILRLFAANPNNNFVNWVYETSGVIIGPFRGVFPNPNLEGFVIDFTAIFALLVYGLFGMLALYIIDLLAPSRVR
jgi:uncharacterized protein YggT (Ycf19 family)